MTHPNRNGEGYRGSNRRGPQSYPSNNSHVSPHSSMPHGGFENRPHGHLPSHYHHHQQHRSSGYRLPHSQQEQFQSDRRWIDNQQSRHAYHQANMTGWQEGPMKQSRWQKDEEFDLHSRSHHHHQHQQHHSPWDSTRRDFNSYPANRWDAIPPSATLILRNLAPPVTERMIMEALRSFQPLRARLIMNKGTDEHRGFAFVDFESVEDATKVVTAFADEPLVLEHRDVSIGYTDNNRPMRRPVPEMDSRMGGSFHGRPDYRGPPSSGPRLDWICDQCKVANFARRTVCFKCEAPKSEHAQEVPQSYTSHSNSSGPPTGDSDTPLMGDSSFNHQGNYQENECDIPSNVLVIRMLPPDVSEGELQVAFAAFEGVQDIRLIRDRATNLSRGFGFIEFMSVECAQKVLEASGSLLVNDQPVRVAYARESYHSKSHSKTGATAQVPHVVNPIAAAALEQAQWSLANGYGGMQQQQDQQQSTMVDDVNALLSNAAAAATPHVEEPKKPWPLPFETGGGSYVYVSEYGLYYDPDSMFYYDAQSKLYYNQFKGLYYRCLDGTKGAEATFDLFTPPLPVDDAKVTGSNADMNTNPPATTSMGISINLSKKEKKKPISFGIKTSALGNKAKPTAGAFVGSGVASGGVGMKRKSAEDIAKWTQVQRETKMEEQQAEVQKTAEPSKPSPTANLSVTVTKVDKTPSTDITKSANSVVDTLVDVAPICLLCRRKFNSLEQLRKHETLSKLHKDNLAKAKQDKEVVTAQYRDAVGDELKEDRHSKRQRVPSTSQASSTSAPNRPTPSPAVATSSDTSASTPLESGIGGKMLKMMGWKSGEGLGKHGTGITAPINAVGNAGRESAGVGAKPSISASIDLSELASYKERLQQVARARYDVAQGGNNL